MGLTTIGIIYHIKTIRKQIYCIIEQDDAFYHCTNTEVFILHQSNAGGAARDGTLVDRASETTGARRAVLDYLVGSNLTVFTYFTAVPSVDCTFGSIVQTRKSHSD